MTSSARKILDEALALPEDERRRVGEAILRSIATELRLSPAWKAEIEARIQRMERGEGELVDAVEHLRSLRAKLSG